MSQWRTAVTKNRKLTQLISTGLACIMPESNKSVPFPYAKFDSSVVSPMARHEYWQESLSSVCELRFPAHASPESFGAVNEMWILGHMLWSKRTCGPHILCRSSRSIRLDQIDHYKLHLCVNNAAHMDLLDGRRSLYVRTGGCVLPEFDRIRLFGIQPAPLSSLD